MLIGTELTVLCKVIFSLTLIVEGNAGFLLYIMTTEVFVIYMYKLFPFSRRDSTIV